MDVFNTRTTSGKLAIGILIAIVLLCLLSTIFSFVSGANGIILAPTLSYVSGALYLISTLLLIAFVIFVIVKATQVATNPNTVAGVSTAIAQETVY